MKFGSSVGIFLSSVNLICRSTDISKCSEGPFDFEITRVDCILYMPLIDFDNVDFCPVVKH